MAYAINPSENITVFVAYANQDLESIQPVLYDLKTVFGDVNVFLDKDIPANTPWSEKLDRELVSADVVVVIWTKNATTSSWVLMESAIARSTKRLVQLKLEVCDIPVPFSEAQHITLPEEWERHGRSHHSEFQRLQTEIRRVAANNYSLLMRDSFAESTSKHVKTALVSELGRLEGKRVLRTLVVASLCLTAICIFLVLICMWSIKDVFHHDSLTKLTASVAKNYVPRDELFRMMGARPGDRNDGLPIVRNYVQNFPVKLDTSKSSRAFNPMSRCWFDTIADQSPNAESKIAEQIIQNAKVKGLELPESGILAQIIAKPSSDDGFLRVLALASKSTRFRHDITVRPDGDVYIRPTGDLLTLKVRSPLEEVSIEIRVIDAHGTQWKHENLTTIPATPTTGESQTAPADKSDFQKVQYSLKGGGWTRFEPDGNNFKDEPSTPDFSVITDVVIRIIGMDPKLTVFDIDEITFE